jgi:hypothetical protein
MKSSEFLQSLRKIIREEVQVAVESAMKNINIIQEHTVTQKSPVRNAPKFTSELNPKKKQIQPKQFVKDPLLNSLLNETTGFNSINYNDFEEWPTMSMNSINSRIPSSPSMVSDVNGNVIPIENLPDSVANALTKDYSSLLKAIDKKKSGI